MKPYRILKRRLRVKRRTKYSGLQPDIGYQVVFKDFPAFQAVLCRRAKWQPPHADAWYVIERNTGLAVAHGADTRSQVCEEAAAMLKEKGAKKIAAAIAQNRITKP